MTDSANKTVLKTGDRMPDGKQIKPLFTALSMVKKYGRDALICGAMSTGMQLASGAGTDVLRVDPFINLTAMSLLAAVFITIGRYAGGAVGYALDSAYDKQKKNPHLTTSFGRKSLAGVGGVVAGSAFVGALMFSLLVMGMKSAENEPANTSAQPTSASYTAAQTSAPVVNI